MSVVHFGPMAANPLPANMMDRETLLFFKSYYDRLLSRHRNEDLRKFIQEKLTDIELELLTRDNPNIVKFKRK